MERTVKFVDANKNRWIITAKITHRNGYPEFAMSGKSGQCQDNIKPDGEYQQELVDIWNKWHLKNLIIYTQTELKEWDENDTTANFWERIEELFDSIEENEEEKFSSKKASECSEEELDIYDDAIIAIGLHLDLTVEELEDIEHQEYGWGNCLYNVQGEDYYSGTEEDMFEATKEYIGETLWAFNDSFLENYGVLAKINSVGAILKPLHEQCESGNDAILELVQWDVNADEITQDAIDADGIGHFLNNYDGTSDEYNVFGTNYIVCQR